MTENTNNSSIDDLSVSYYEEGIEITKQLDKTVLTRGAWTTIMYKYQDWDKNHKIMVQLNSL